MRYRLYECQECKDKFITDNRARWKPNFCKEGCSMVDAEEHYIRVSGRVKLIKEAENLDEFTEDSNNQ
tara:strand:- start:2482 stop:2685 length:204 start_codon:yes stop_codon:yes gene_type:complete